MTFFRNSFLIFFSFIPCAIISSEQDVQKLKICVFKEYTPGLVKYFIPNNTGFCFVTRNGTETKGPFSFGVHQITSHMNSPSNTLTVVWNVKYIDMPGWDGTYSLGIKKQNNTTDPITPAMDGVKFQLSKPTFPHALENYEHIVNTYTDKVPSTHDTAFPVYDSTIFLNGKNHEMQLLTTVMKRYAQERLLTLKYNNQVLYKPSAMQYAAAWLSFHKKSICLGVIGCLSVALYFMLNKNSSNRLLTASAHR